MEPLQPANPDSLDIIEAVDAAAQAVVRLQTALAANGVKLPSLSVDLVSCSRPLDPRPLVELGRCNLDTADALTAALRRAAER